MNNDTEYLVGVPLAAKGKEVYKYGGATLFYWWWQASDLYVRLGEYDFKRNNDSRSFNFRVVEIRQHKEFQLSNYHNDIAILKLHRPAVFNSYVWPICLPPLGLQLVNQSAVVIGWGTQWYGGPHSTVLMEVTIPVWDYQRCTEAFSDTIFNSTICAGAYEGGKDSCQNHRALTRIVNRSNCVQKPIIEFYTANIPQGDSGGPLMYQLASGRWAVVGVVSWGIRCGEPAHPGVYARVDQFLSWIVENSQF
ncbi:Proclotting enzyme [Eumeta japonica]|uniref:Proclotting enzyme n=1 Tax=Eumeta variegata TaxID=151549 RepID=A0A4C1UKZ8_EUMVA|nr:Proclotting enzyme [Eumeta japonica]